MNYIGIKEENTNIARVAGIMIEDLKYSHSVEGEKFYEFSLEAKRLSDSKDVIPVTISERMLTESKPKLGDYVEVLGEYRSFNKLINEKSKLILHLFAKDLAINCKEKENSNEIKLIGYICKSPVYRKTPFEREICDILLAVNRSNYHKSDYIPCILWGRNARFIANQNIGTKIEIYGRIQSRQYSKTLIDGSVEDRTAYEVSCQKVSLINNVANFQINKKDEIEKIVN